uniref:Septin-type G domain-containing protein n=1 Tax=Poecilia reticulata TaxID=8081 RepID=A0A3P9NIE2_POERE
LDLPLNQIDIISKYTLIPLGCPAVYKLKPKVETLGSLKKLIVGEKNPNTPNKTILVVGETGTGKSTLIDALINHAMGVKFEDQVWFKVIEEEEKSQTASQTSDVKVYQVYEGKALPFSLTIIDTPGYADTRGIERDVIIREQLLQLFQLEHGVHELHAVGLVVKATENRVKEHLRYVFDSVLSLFGKDLEKNIVALCTHSNGMYPKNVLTALEAVKIKCARDERNDPVHFLFDNCQSNDRSHPNNMKILKRMFEDAEEEMNKLVKFMETVEPQRLDTTLDVITSRIRLTACIYNLQDRINQRDLKQREIRQTEEALKENKEKLENDTNFTIEVDEVYKDKENIGVGKWGLTMFIDGATCCTVCEENCHFPCTTAWYPSRCKVMSKGKCTICTKKCPVSDHVKDQWRYVTKTRRVKKTLEDVKEKYEVKQEGMTGILEVLKQETEKLEEEKNQLLEEAYQHVIKLEEIALNVDSLSTSVNLELLIEKMKEKGETAKAEKLEKIMKRQDKGVLSVMKSWFGKVRSYIQPNPES